jgi:EthD domain
MLKVLAFLSKRRDMETGAFIEYYEQNHVPLILSLAPAPIVYKRRYLVRDDEIGPLPADAIACDVVTELGFADREAFLAWGAAVRTGKPGEAVAADEAKFLDRSKTRSFVVEEHVTSG